MFTGIIEEIATVADVSGDENGRRFRLATSRVAIGLPIGASVAVNGVCLTAVEVDGSSFEVEAIIETLRRTTLGDVLVGDPVNLERAMPADGRFDGHIVQGHVDGVGSVRAFETEGDGRRLQVEAPAALRPYIVEKGSVTIDGVSLTVAQCDDATFEVALIPHTLSVTTLGHRQVGDHVNLETDILAKYVERLLERSA